MLTRRGAIRLISGAMVAAGWGKAGFPQTLTPQRALPVAKDAYIFGYPMVAGYGTMYADAIDKANPRYKAPFNEVHSEARVHSPEDADLAEPNCDVSLSWLWADLRTEPLVLGVPAIPRNRYYSIQFIDLYTWNFAYVGTRATGVGAGKFLLAGPGWRGDTPRGVRKTIEAETDFVLAIYRTQLFNPADAANVEKIQSFYSVETLSEYLKKPPPPAAPAPDFPAFNPDKVKSLTFFDYLAFLLQFCPMKPADDGARESFAAMGVEPGKPFTTSGLWPEMREAIQIGMGRGLRAIESGVTTTDSATELFGSRRAMKNNYLNRAVGAMSGIYGSSKNELFDIAYVKDIDDRTLDGAVNRYGLRFEKGKLPPVKAFWSLTLYDANTKQLVANPINRYLINSAMAPGLAHSADGAVTIYIQKDAPTGALAANWLPAPSGPFILRLRCYWPDATILDGRWTPPTLRAA